MNFIFSEYAVWTLVIPLLVNDNSGLQLMSLINLPNQHCGGNYSCNSNSDRSIIARSVSGLLRITQTARVYWWSLEITYKIKYNVRAVKMLQMFDNCDCFIVTKAVKGCQIDSLSHPALIKRLLYWHITRSVVSPDYVHFVGNWHFKHHSSRIYECFLNFPTCSDIMLSILASTPLPVHRTDGLTAGGNFDEISID